MNTRKRILISLAIALALIAAGAVKWFFFPSIKDAYFTMSQRSLDRVPGGLVVARPTHFAKSSRNGIVSDLIEVSGKRTWRMMGRNVSLQQLISAAYGRNAARILLPAVAPKGNFDFLVTVPSDQEARLQAAIRKNLRLIAKPELRDENVMALKVENAALPGLTPSSPEAKPNVHRDKDKLHFTHLRPQELISGLEQVIKMPVVDKTSLTNFYDFSLDWDRQTEHQLGDAATAPAVLKKILSAWGLRLEPDTDQVEMLVVKSAS